MTDLIRVNQEQIDSTQGGTPHALFRTAAISKRGSQEINIKEMDSPSSVHCIGGNQLRANGAIKRERDFTYTGDERATIVVRHLVRPAR